MWQSAARAGPCRCRHQMIAERADRGPRVLFVAVALAGRFAFGTRSKRPWPPSPATSRQPEVWLLLNPPTSAGIPSRRRWRLLGEWVGEDDDGVHHHPEVLGQSCPVGSEPRAVCGVGPIAQADEVTYRARQRNHVGPR